EYGSPPPADLGEQRLIRQLARRDLVRRDVQSLELRDALLIERRREKDDTELLGVCLQLAERACLELEAAQQLQLRLRRAGRLLLIGGFRRTRCRDRVGVEGLELDRIGSGC